MDKPNMEPTKITWEALEAAGTTWEEIEAAGTTWKSLEELGQEYFLEAVKLREYIREHEEKGDLPEIVIIDMRRMLRDTREIARALRRYYDLPRPKCTGITGARQGMVRMRL